MTREQRQEALIDQLRAENAQLKKRCKRAIQGQQDLRAMFTNPEPPQAEEWADMVREAWAEIDDGES